MSQTLLSSHSESNKHQQKPIVYWFLWIFVELRMAAQQCLMVKSINPNKIFKHCFKIDSTISQEYVYVSLYFGLHWSVKPSKLIKEITWLSWKFTEMLCTLIVYVNIILVLEKSLSSRGIFSLFLKGIIFFRLWIFSYQRKGPFRSKIWW